MPPNYTRKRRDKEGKAIQALAAEEYTLPKLTLKQERFVKHLLAGKTNREAYRLAFDCSNMVEESINTAASRLAHSDKIERSIRILQRIGLESSVVNRENHLAELARLRELAIDNTQISAGVQAEHYRGRVAGLYNDKINLNIGPSDEMLLSQVASLFGADIAKTLAKSLGCEDGETIDVEPSQDADLLRLPSPTENS